MNYQFLPTPPGGYVPPQGSFLPVDRQTPLPLPAQAVATPASQAPPGTYPQAGYAPPPNPYQTQASYTPPYQSMAYPAQGCYQPAPGMSYQAPPTGGYQPQAYTESEYTGVYESRRTKLTHIQILPVSGRSNFFKLHVSTAPMVH
jgi:hypothetical protein